MADVRYVLSELRPRIKYTHLTRRFTYHDDQREPAKSKNGGSVTSSPAGAHLDRDLQS